MSSLTEEEFDSLADKIAEERDKYPRVSTDMDSAELAEKVEEWLVKANKLEAPKKSDYILATGENIKELLLEERRLAWEKFVQIDRHIYNTTEKDEYYAQG